MSDEAAYPDLEAGRLVEVEMSKGLSNIFAKHCHDMSFWGKDRRGLEARIFPMGASLGAPSVVPQDPPAMRDSGFLCFGCGGDYGTGGHCETCGYVTRSLCVIDGKIV